MQQLKATVPQLKTRIVTRPKQVIQITKQTILRQTLHGQPITTTTIMTRQPLGLRHHLKLKHKIRRILPLPKKMTTKTMVLKNLRREIPPQKKIYKRYKQISPTRIPHLKRGTIVTEILQRTQVTRQTERTRMLQHIK